MRMPIRKMSTEHVLFAIPIARMPVQIDDLCSRMIKNWTDFFSCLLSPLIKPFSSQ